MADILPFEIKYVSVVAACDHCAATWIAHMRETEYNRYLKGEKKICPYCKTPNVFFCMRSLDER